MRTSLLALLCGAVTGCAIIPSDTSLNDTVAWYEYHRDYYEHWTASAGKPPIWHTTSKLGLIIIAVPVIYIYRAITGDW